ncbi:MAG: hypothetical protein GYA21_08235 [Myxococcales bacterium]|nr:hypothetical protein [Myxococcales bacterium]
MEQTPLDPILSEMSQPPQLTEIQRARKEFFAAIPDLGEDDPSFEALMAFFLSWFVLDRPLEGQPVTPLQWYAAKPERTPEQRALCIALSANRHSLFRVEKFGAGSVMLRDLFLNEPLKVNERRHLAGLRPKDILEARLFPREPGLVFLSGNFLVHPTAAVRVIGRAVEEHRATGRPPRRQILDRLRVGCFRYRDRFRERVDAARLYAEALEPRGTPDSSSTSG